MSGGSFIGGVHTSGPPRPSYANVAAGATAGAQSTFELSPHAASAAANRPSHPSLPVDRIQMAREERGTSNRGLEGDGPAGGTAGSALRSQGGAASRWSSELGRFDDGLGCALHPEHPPFFTPTYLRHSRHAQRLHADWDAHVAALQERARVDPPGKRPALSAGSSSSNLAKLHSSAHRGVVQDVIERLPPAGQSDEEGDSTMLPGRWNEEDKMPGLEILGDGGEVRFTGLLKTSDEAASIRSDCPIPKEVGLYYFEVTVLSRGKDGLIGIGFSGRGTTLARLPGWESESWAYHGDDGYAFSGSANGKAYGPRFSSQDVVGCGINFRTGTAFFTKNGVLLGTAFNDIKGDRLYPSIGLKKPGEHLRANFGRHPFVFDIDAMMDQERALVLSEVRREDVTALHPPDDEQTLIHKLISQYLVHEGYVETSRAFAHDLRDRQQALAATDQPAVFFDDGDDVNALHRQKIRAAILDGDVDRALKYTHSYYPAVLQDERNRDVYFRLRCRKFIEMMRRYSELQSAASPSLSKSVDSLASNGHRDPAEPFAEDREQGNDDEGDDEEEEDQADAQMELDDQLQREASKGLELPASSHSHEDVDMDASTELPPRSALLTRQNDLLTAAIEYGRELQAEFGSDPRPSVQKRLSDMFAIMAYTDPRASVVGGLLDKKGRVGIAEELNGAILVSLGKPSSAALEKLCAQTEAFLDATAAKTGGATAFVNVRSDFLQA